MNLISLSSVPNKQNQLYCKAISRDKASKFLSTFIRSLACITYPIQASHFEIPVLAMIYMAQIKYVKFNKILLSNYMGRVLKSK